MPTDYRSLYDKDFIGAWDLVDGDKVITITKVKGGELTSVGGRKSKKPVVFFKGSEKGFALNATNGKTIAAMYGNFTEGWAGKSITLYKSTTRSPQGDGDVDCIRVRPQPPKGGGNLVEQGEEPLVTEDQAMELQTLCTTGGKDLSAEFLKMAECDQFTELLARAYPNAKKWITRQRLVEHEATQP